jgi:serine/threonine protein kinase
MVLKVTSILSRHQRDIAEKEAKLLSRLSHPSIIKMYDTCYRSVAHDKSSRRGSKVDPGKERPQHLILMEHCEGGHALEVCTRMAATGTRFDLSTLIIAFGQICNAVSYLHAQRPPIVHRDLKPANFLVKNGAYKLCDFGSAVFGHVDLKTQSDRAEAEEVIQKTTTQMFRAPEMVDLYMAKRLTQATDVWALGCCLYSLAFLQNCFEEGSNLAILSRKYKIPDDNPYGEGLVELIDRMLTIDSKERADMTEVILCLSAVYSGRDLPPRRERKKEKEKKEDCKSKENAGTFRTDGQGVYGEDLEIDPKEIQKSFPSKSAKPLKSNSAAARRKAAAESGGAVGGSDLDLSSFHSTAKGKDPFGGDPFAGNGNSLFASFEGSADGADEVPGMNFNDPGGWDEPEGSGKFDAFASFSPDTNTPEFINGNVDDEGNENGEEITEGVPRRRRSNSGRKNRSSGGSDHQDSKGEPGAEDTPKRAVRRTRSSGASRRRSNNAEIESMAASRTVPADGEAENGDDDGKDSSRRKASASTRARRSPSTVEAMKASSTSLRSSGSSSRRESSSRSSARKERDGDREKDSSNRSRSRAYSEDDE